MYPEEYASFLREGVPVKLTDRNSSNVYTALTDARGVAAFDVAAGLPAFGARPPRCVVGLQRAPSNRWTSPARTGM